MGGPGAARSPLDRRLAAGRGDLDRRATAAKVAAPKARKEAVDFDFEDQSLALQQAERDFAAPPPVAAAAPGGSPPSPKPASPSGGTKKATESVNAFRR